MRLPCHRITTNQKALVIFYRPCLTWLPPLLNDDLLKAELKIRWRTSVFCFVFFFSLVSFFFFLYFSFLAFYFLYEIIVIQCLGTLFRFSLCLFLCVKTKKKRIQLMFCCIIEDSVSCESILLYFLLSVPFICLFSICLSSVIFKNLQHLEKKMRGIYYFLKVRHFLFSLRKKNQQ